METEIKKSTFKIKIVETAGDSIKSILQKSHPFPHQKCSDHENCMVCNNGRGNCRANNITYKIECECEDQYIGETARNGYSRGKEHLNSLAKQSDDSVLYRHIKEKHHDNSTQIPKFKMTILSNHKTALDRQVAEAVLIGRVPHDKLMNKKNEWGHAKVVRSTLTAE